jgi:hypothetical protein
MQGPTTPTDPDPGQCYNVGPYKLAFFSPSAPDFVTSVMYQNLDIALDAAQVAKNDGKIVAVMQLSAYSGFNGGRYEWIVIQAPEVAEVANVYFLKDKNKTFALIFISIAALVTVIFMLNAKN